MKQHIVWQCTPSSETRGRRKGFEATGCQVWNITSTSKKLPLQMTPCHICGNRPRKTEGNTWSFDWRTDAVASRNVRIQNAGYQMHKKWNAIRDERLNKAKEVNE